MHKIKSRLPVLLSLLLAVTALADATNSAVVPAFRTKPKFWMERHERYLQEAKKGPYDIVFLGDSITDFWHDKGSNVWNEYYAPRHALNLGIRGDLTQHVLWRIENGELDGLNPKVLVLLIGTNNNGRDKDTTNAPPRNTPAQAIEGVTKVVKEVREKLPKTKILLLAIFPREDAYSAPAVNIRETNEGIAKLADGKTVTFLDINANFVDKDGKLLDGVMPDKLHPDEKGYQIWAKAMEPTLERLLK